ncbi:hypothetical protein IQ07DRAFT_605211 [Pyrenochaeta sp. DS3sAY3a]|nr:hypothetical protein IQ07DRAFT_605211 [Pyrenochaeta sp. DS3sAY3a]
MRLFNPALLLASLLLAEAACRFEFWQYENLEFLNGEWHAYMVRADVHGDNMNLPRMIDDFCSIFNSTSTSIPASLTESKTRDHGLLTSWISAIGNTGGGSVPRECIRDSNTSGHARTDYREGWDGVLQHHERYLRIIDQLKFFGMGLSPYYTTESSDILT